MNIIPPVNARPDALSTLHGEKLTAEMLTVKIDQLLNLLDRKDISPQQRETLIRALASLQQERTLLSQLHAGAKPSQPSSLMQSGRPEGTAATRTVLADMQSAQTVVIGDTAKALMSKSEIQHALQVNQGLDKALGGLSPSSQTSDVVRSPLENYLAVAAQNPVVNVKPDEAENKITSVTDPKPLFGLIPQEWVSKSMRISARSSGWVVFVGVMVLLGMVLWAW